MGTDMDDHGVAQLDRVAHESGVHAVLLMDLLRLVQRIDPDAFQRQVDQAEHGRGSHVLEYRLAFLRSVQIQAAVG
jgi:hypothetical protein